MSPFSITKKKPINTFHNPYLYCHPVSINPLEITNSFVVSHRYNADSSSDASLSSWQRDNAARAKASIPHRQPSSNTQLICNTDVRSISVFSHNHNTNSKRIVDHMEMPEMHWIPLANCLLPIRIPHAAATLQAFHTVPGSAHSGHSNLNSGKVCILLHARS